MLFKARFFTRFQAVEDDKGKYDSVKRWSMTDEQLDELEQKIKSDFRKHQTESSGF